MVGPVAIVEGAMPYETPRVHAMVATDRVLELDEAATLPEVGLEAGIQHRRAPRPGHERGEAARIEAPAK